MSKITEEINIEGFDENNIPVLRIFDNETSYLIFEEFPPENDKLSEEQIDNFDRVLSKITGVKVVHDDRELFIIYSNNSIVIGKVISFFNNL